MKPIFLDFSLNFLLSSHLAVGSLFQKTWVINNNNNNNKLLLIDRIYIFCATLLLLHHEINAFRHNFIYTMWNQKLKIGQKSQLFTSTDHAKLKLDLKKKRAKSKKLCSKLTLSSHSNVPCQWREDIYIYIYLYLYFILKINGRGYFLYLIQNAWSNISVYTIFGPT